MSTLSKANKARASKALDKLYRFSHGVKSMRQAIDEGHFVEAKIEMVPKVKWNRTKYNRMNGEEQQEYERKMKELKTEYQLWYDDRTFIDVPKAAYDYFNSKN